MDKIDRQTIYSEIINFLKKNPNTQIANIANHLDQQLGENVAKKFRKEVFEEIHLLLLNNILMIGHNYFQWGHPWLEVTEYGKKCIREGNLIPLDPEGYIMQIQQELPDIDSVIIEYLKESISAFNRDLILSSTITLGVASEQAMLILMESFGNYISNSKQLKSVKDKLEGEDSIFRKYKVFKDTLLQLPKSMRAGFPQNFDVHIDTLFNFIRLNRNETGHPLGGGRDRNIQAANLQAFKLYLIDIYKLMDYFAKNPLT